MRTRAFASFIASLSMMALPAVGHDAMHRQDAAPAECHDRGFISESSASMDMMMTDMTVKPSGNIDLDFTAMMIPHHQGAVDMAVSYLRHGANPLLLRLAQEIVVEQQQEITAMRLAVGQAPPPAKAAPTEIAPQIHCSGAAAMPRLPHPPIPAPAAQTTGR